MNCSEKSDVVNIADVVNRMENENTINKKQKEGQFHIYSCFYNCHYFFLHKHLININV